MTVWQSFVYYSALAFFRAQGDYLDARKLAERESVTDEDKAKAARFRNAVHRLLDEQSNSRPADSTPAK
jgi:hypothetical protein